MATAMNEAGPRMAAGDQPEIRVSAFRWVPGFARGQVRDLRVRWALEEAGLRYEERLIGPEDKATDAYRALQPFEQVPAYEEDDLVLFESGAIVLHIAERSEALMPRDPAGRARTRTWVLAALNSIEPYLDGVADLDIFHADAEWAKQRRPGELDAAKGRLAKLEAYMASRDYLEDRFTAGDLMMTTVLRIPDYLGLLAEFPALDAYKRRCEARPAFQKALADQLAVFDRHSAPDAWKDM